MSWLLNLFQLGRSADPISERSPNGVMGSRYNIIAKAPAGETLLDYSKGFQRSFLRSFNRGFKYE